MKSRKVVTRSGRGFRGYFPSKKLNRSVEFESILERDAFYLFEHSPGVKSYQEQPELILYESLGEMHKYYPDVGVTLRLDRLIHAEIKPLIRLDKPALISKFQSIIQRYKTHSAEFIILTEKTIRQEPLFSNLKMLNSVYKFDLDINQIFQSTKVLLQADTKHTYNDLVHMFGKTKVLMMLARHLVFCDLYQKLESKTNFVRLPKENDHDAVYF